MKIALLSGADPRTATIGPVVRLPAGAWRLRIYGMVDSALRFVGVKSPAHLLYDGHMLHLSDVSDVQIEFAARGAEQYLTVIAERQSA